MGIWLLVFEKLASPWIAFALISWTSWFPDCQPVIIRSSAVEAEAAVGRY